MTKNPLLSVYRGRLAPSPTGYMHFGHAKTFWTAQQRTRRSKGALVLRNEDLDRARSRTEFVSAMLEDLSWFGLEWQEGPDIGGAFGPYTQSERETVYRRALKTLLAGGLIYPCYCSRQDVLRALQAPHTGEDEPIYPGTCRPAPMQGLTEQGSQPIGPIERAANSSLKFNWRFRVPDGQTISFFDGQYGPQRFIAGKDFGDFIIWRHDDIPAYQLAVVVDDAAMQITEVVRGEDLLKSTARQLLLYRALDLREPKFFHCPLVRNEAGIRLAKRDDAFSLRALRAKGYKPEELRASWNAE